MKDSKKNSLGIIISDDITNSDSIKTVDLKNENHLEENFKTDKVNNINGRGRILYDEKTNSIYCPFSYDKEEKIFPKAIKHNDTIIEIAGENTIPGELIIHSENDEDIEVKCADGFEAKRENKKIYCGRKD